MKKLSVFLFAVLLMFGVVGISNTAKADSWSLSPSGMVPFQSTVDLIFNYTGGGDAYFSGIQLSFTLDLSEITPTLNKSGNPIVTWGNPNPYGGDLAGLGSALAGNQLQIAAGNISGYNQWNMGDNVIATLDLTLVAAGVYDGVDLSLNAQTGSEGIANWDGSQLWQGGGAAGPDFGGGVIPIPGTLWLFCSGLIGFLAFRKKKRQ